MVHGQGGGNRAGRWEGPMVYRANEVDSMWTGGVKLKSVKLWFFHITFMLGLFHNRKCCNFINLFSCILWDLIVMSLILSWQRLLKMVDLTTWLVTGSGLSTHERTCEEHMWKFKSQHISQLTRDLANLRVACEMH